MCPYVTKLKTQSRDRIWNIHDGFDKNISFFLNFWFPIFQISFLGSIWIGYTDDENFSRNSNSSDFFGIIFLGLILQLWNPLIRAPIQISFDPFLYCSNSFRSIPHVMKIEQISKSSPWILSDEIFQEISALMTHNLWVIRQQVSLWNTRVDQKIPFRIWIVTI